MKVSELQYKLAPIVLFAYKRADTLKQCIDALKHNIYANESELIIYSDAPKNDQDAILVKEVRCYLKTISGFKVVSIKEGEYNKGLANSIIDGVSETLKSNPKVIVMEDDIIVARGFLKYMNDALNYYRDDRKVMEVSAFMFPIDDQALPDTFFYPANTCWGWGTWDRAWLYFEPDCEKIINELQKKKISWNEFNSLQGNEFKKQLFLNFNRKKETWAVKWHASIILQRGTVLHPKTTYVKNVGFGGEGENCGKGTSEGRIDNELCLNVTSAMSNSADLALRRLKIYFRFRYSLVGKIYKRINVFMNE